MYIEELALPGVKIMVPKYYEDFRGYYCETYSSHPAMPILLYTS